MLEKTKILLVDDHAAIRKALTQLIEQEEDFKICGEAEDVAGALIAVREKTPAIAVIDISLDVNEGGVQLIRRLHDDYPELPTLAVSLHEEALYAEEALNAGARGYLMKMEAADNIITALRQILKGDIYVSGALGGYIAEKYKSYRLHPN